MDLRKLAKICDSEDSALARLKEKAEEYGTAFKTWVANRDSVSLRIVKDDKDIIYKATPINQLTSQDWEIKLFKPERHPELLNEVVQVTSNEELYEYFIKVIPGDYKKAFLEFDGENFHSSTLEEKLKKGNETVKEGDPIEVVLLVGGKGGGFPEEEELEEYGLTPEEITQITTQYWNEYNIRLLEYKNCRKDEGTFSETFNPMPDELDDEDMVDLNFSETDLGETCGFVGIYDGEPTEEYMREQNIYMDWFKTQKLESGFWAIYGMSSL